MPDWFVQVLEDPTEAVHALQRGEVLALDIDPRGPTLRLAPVQPGLGDAEVGQRARYRRWLGASGGDPIAPPELAAVGAAARVWLSSSDAQALLACVQGGYAHTRLWTGDELGEWSPDAWAAADALFAGVVAAMEAVEPPPTDAPSSVATP